MLIRSHNQGLIDGTFTDVTVDTVTNRAPAWWNDPYTPPFERLRLFRCCTVNEKIMRIHSGFFLFIPFGIHRMAILGSREYTCVHPDVSRGPNKNDGCKALLDGRNVSRLKTWNEQKWKGPRFLVFARVASDPRFSIFIYFCCCYETMSNCSQNCWIHWNSAALCFKWPLLATILCVWEIWSGSCNRVYMYHVFYWLAKKKR